MTGAGANGQGGTNVIDDHVSLIAASALGWAVSGRTAPSVIDATTEQLRSARVTVLSMPVCDDATRRRAAALIDDLLRQSHRSAR
jgi:hypothetical protein